MKTFIFAMLAATSAALSGAALAEYKIDPSTVALPWENSTADAVYKFADHPHTVFVLEAFELSCEYCNENAPNVDALATEYAANSGVQVLDLGLDTQDRDFQTWIANHHPNHPVTKDVDHAVWNALTQDNSIPQTFIVGCDGALVNYTVGLWDDAAKATIHSAITTALAACH
jgi:hypothetical protein